MTRGRPPADMLLLSGSGMAIGLAIDSAMTPPALIAALCTSASGTLAATVRFHLSVMPASYVLTVAGGLLALALAANGRASLARVGAGMATIILMLAGMIGGGWLGPEIAALFGARPGFGLLAASMAAGMALAAGAAAARLPVRDRARKARRPQYIMYQ